MKNTAHESRRISVPARLQAKFPLVEVDSESTIFGLGLMVKLLYYTFACSTFFFFLTFVSRNSSFSKFIKGDIIC